MKKITIFNGCEVFHATAVYRQIAALGDRLAPLLDPHGNRMGPWSARPQPEVVRGQSDDTTVIRWLCREPHEKWKVAEHTRFTSSDFTADFDEWWSWEFDAEQPFPFQSWAHYGPQTIGLWSDLSENGYGLTLTGSPVSFLSLVGVKRVIALPIIDACEQSGTIDTQEAMVARLAFP